MEEDGMQTYIEANGIQSLPSVKVFYKEKEIYKTIGYKPDFLTSLKENITKVYV